MQLGGITLAMVYTFMYRNYYQHEKKNTAINFLVKNTKTR
jgi:hypothetical protein